MGEPDLQGTERLSPRVRAGLAHHRAGRLLEAAQEYQRALRENGADADALLLLGLLARLTGRRQGAIRLTALAVELRPQSAGFHLSLAQAYLADGNGVAAAVSCRQAVELNPRLAAAWCCLGEAEAARRAYEAAQRAWNTAAGLDGKSARAERSLGHLLARLGRFDEAIVAYRAGLRKAPGDAMLHYALGAALAASEDRRAAKAAYREALRLRPNFPEALLNLGNVHYDEGAFAAAAVCCRKALGLRPTYAKAWCNLGNALQMMGGAREATGCYERTLALDPKTVAARHNLGNAWMARRDYAQAEACFRETLAMDAGRAEHYNSLGNALFQQRRNDEAEACYRKALKMDPGYAAVHTNLANVLMRQSSRAEMIRHYERALELDPKSAGGHYNLALAYLRQGRYAEGWPAHEWRWDFRELRLRRRRFAAPQWRGEALQGATILLHAEQGLGDTLQFVRYAPLVAERGGTVVLEVQPRLVRLLQGLPGVSRVVGRGEQLGDFAWQCPLMSIPLAFGTTVDTIPRRIPYVRADEEEIRAARQRFAGTGFRVGLAWAGNSQYRSDEQRSMPLRALLPLADVPRITWFSLQFGPACGQMRAAGERFPLIDASSASRDLAETAALMATLDLVITVDTSVAHLAGAMGVPLWVVLPHLADWRWMEERADSPWYPQARLFRQPAPGDWASAVGRMRWDLERSINGPIGDECAGAASGGTAGDAHAVVPWTLANRGGRLPDQTRA
jgi:tetratricopeptide (TPR) repeat protein